MYSLHRLPHQNKINKSEKKLQILFRTKCSHLGDHRFEERGAADQACCKERRPERSKVAVTHVFEWSTEGDHAEANNPPHPQEDGDDGERLCEGSGRTTGLDEVNEHCAYDDGDNTLCHCVGGSTDACDANSLYHRNQKIRTQNKPKGGNHSTTELQMQEKQLEGLLAKLRTCTFIHL